ncbi:unnamed protein product [Amoebophrya sp. A25]|nr:unnamed protein product [Amoebophrya sp. A25]|eukprot:GSA25T00026851001.1
MSTATRMRWLGAACVLPHSSITDAIIVRHSKAPSSAIRRKHREDVVSDLNENSIALGQGRRLAPQALLQEQQEIAGKQAASSVQGKGAQSLVRGLTKKGKKNKTKSTKTPSSSSISSVTSSVLGTSSGTSASETTSLGKTKSTSSSTSQSLAQTGTQSPSSEGLSTSSTRFLDFQSLLFGATRDDAKTNVEEESEGGIHLFSSVDNNICHCDHCSVRQRFPSEIMTFGTSSTVTVKCGPRKQSADQCVNQNALSVLQSDVGAALNFQRFCFYECLPSQGRTSPLQSACVALQDDEVWKLQPGKDPALLSMPMLLEAKTAGASETTSGILISKEPGRNPVADAKAASESLSAEAKKTHDAAHGIAENSKATSNPDIDEENVEVAMQKMVQESEKSATLATESATAARDALDQTREEARAAAVAAGKEVIDSLAKEEAAAAQAAAAYAEKQANTPQAKAAAAMEKAGKPFFDQMKGAEVRARDYTVAADAKSAKAAAMEAEARELEKRANAANIAGDRPTADATIASAEQKWEEGQALAKKSVELRGQAGDIIKLIPQYQHAGTVAAALAAQAANPAFMAPPHILPPPAPDPMASWAGPDPMAQFRRAP